MPPYFPKISIVTPSFNQAAYLESTILSVISQGYPNLEYIIIDGGSTDGSVDIIKKYESKIAFWVSERDAGLYDALQKGFEKSTGEIMAWINSDDMYHRKSLFLVADIFERFSKVRWLMGSNTFYDEQGNSFLYENDAYQQRCSKWRMYLNDGNYIQQESVFWKRDLWIETGSYIDKNYALAADFELWSRFFRKDELYTTSYILGGFRLRTENQKSLDLRNQYIQEMKTVLNRELKLEEGKAYLLYCKSALKLSSLIPIKKWRDRIRIKLLKLPKKIIFDRHKGMIFSKR
ncbi:glycosyltransferase family 2 protein [Dyadobacter sp. CY312]|uniref:glycosyltransferase family 2 protein n=1 Tax=Dyadobacter sp. CY312 TaxID=2907303 RepID=UPI001F1A86B4|nr:glycosyltransferase family 2 protein [Dyadobacter sp. CY312]MCE7040124.1 glycosyltransferase [Dyadobacter sp. CY312]